MLALVILEDEMDASLRLITTIAMSPEHSLAACR